LELIDEIRAELDANPLLEEKEGGADDLWEPASPRVEELQGGTGHGGRASLVDLLSQPTSLTGSLAWQLRMTHARGEERALAMLVIHNLDEAGYLADVTAEELAEEAGVRPEAVAQAIARVQSLEPVGVAARDRRECLLLQIGARHPGDPALQRIVERHLEAWEAGEQEAVVRDLGLSPEDLARLTGILHSLDPEPGRACSAPAVTFAGPDVIVDREGDGYRTRLNERGFPRLRLSPDCDLLVRRASGEEAGTWRRARSQAKWLLRAIERRQQTILATATYVVAVQRAFLDDGLTELRALNTREVAKKIEVHPSTVSRATRDKWIQTPQGLFPLPFLFDRGVPLIDGGRPLARKAVLARLVDLVVKEPRAPHSDATVARFLGHEGIRISVRAVARLRREVRIPAASERRRGRRGP